MNLIKGVNMKLNYILCLFVLLWGMTGCFDDKGNYDYVPLNSITIENLPAEISVRANVDTIKVTPVVTSALEGIIGADHPDYSFRYRYVIEKGSANDNNQWRVMDSSFVKDLRLFADILPRKYQCRFSVTDKRTGVETSASFKLNVGDVLREGWMILCDEGSGQRVRLDMIGILSETDEVVAYDLLKSRGLPDVRYASSIGWEPTTLIGGEDNIWVMSKEGSYGLDPETFETGEEYNMRYGFGDLREDKRPQRLAYTKKYRLAVDEQGDGYYLDKGHNGAVFEFPFNTLETGTEPQFKLAPWIAVDPSIKDWARGYSAVVYDMTNQRFLEWSEKNSMRCLNIADPEGTSRKFSYTTNKELVYMEMTAFNGYTIYAVLKDAQGKYSLNSFVMNTNWGTRTTFTQRDSLALDLPDIDKAGCFAFSSNLPYMFYAVKNVVYEFNLDTKNCKPVLTLEDEGTQEEITLLKFNLFKVDYVPAKSKEYMAQQYELIVGSVDHNNQTENNGVIRFCEVPSLSKPLVLKKNPYKGFAKPVDVVYRERK